MFGICLCCCMSENSFLLLYHIFMGPSGSEIPVICPIQFLVINAFGTDLLLYAPVLRPAFLKKV